MVLPTPPPYSEPIPNSPFYSPQEYAVSTPSGFLIVGSGLLVSLEGVLSSQGGGGGTNIVAGTGISLSGVNPVTISLTNTGVVPGTYSAPSVTVDDQGRITSISTGSAVASITAGTGLSGGTITDTGTIALSNTSVTAGSYTNGSFTVDQQGRITAASSGSAVTSITAGAGLSGGTITNTGTISLSNTAVSPGVYNYSTITVDQQGRITAASSNSPVTSITAGTGLSGGTITSTGTLALANTAVTPGSYTLGSFTVDQQGRITAASSNSAVTSITAGTGLSGGTITGTGTISLPPTGPGPSSYTYGSFTIDAQGRITAASDGTTPVLPDDFTAKGDILVGTAAGNYSALAVSATDGYGLIADSAQAPYGMRWAALCQGTLTGVTANAPLTVDNSTPAVPALGIDPATAINIGAVSVGDNIEVDGAGSISVLAATTTNPGVVQLYNDTDSQSQTLALTAAQGKNLQDQIDALSVTSNIALAGTLDASTGFVSSVTSAGTAAGFVVGSPLPAAAAGNTDYFVIADAASASYTPPGGVATSVDIGDWFLSSGSVWQFLNVGSNPPYADTVTPGIVKLSTDAETQTGTDQTLAVTPASLQSKISDLVILNSSTSIASSAAVKTVFDLASLAVSRNAFSGPGQVLFGTGVGTYAGLAVGSPGQVLTVDGAGSSLEWTTSTTGTVTSVTAGTGLTGGTITTSGTIDLADTSVNPGSYTLGSFTVDQQGRITAAASGSAVTSITAGTGLSGGTITSTGTLDLADTAVTPGSYTYGSFTVDQQGRITAAASGTDPVLSSDFTGKGALLAGTGVGTYAALGVGGAGQVIVACDACSTGLKWGSVPAAKPDTFGAVLGQTTETGQNISLDGDKLALSNLNGGTGNIAIGASALATADTGSDNVVIGRSTMIQSDCASDNVAVGAYALCANCNDYNTAVGSTALRLATGPGNTALGHRALVNLTTGQCNLGLGRRAGENLTTGCQNVIIGPQVTVSDAAGCCQLSLGFGPGQNWLTGNCHKAIRPGAGIIDCQGCFGTAGQVLSSLGTADVDPTDPGPGSALLWVDPAGVPDAKPALRGIVLGQTDPQCLNVSFDGTCGALSLNTTGTRNVALGVDALKVNTAGSANTALGCGAAQKNTLGNFNVAMGHLSLCNATIATCNTAIGSGALILATGGCNLGVGAGAGSNITTGTNNVAIGIDACVCSATCSCQLAIGYGPGLNWLTGDFSGAIRPGAGIMDCLGCCGLVNQVLTSTGGNAVKWCNVNAICASRCVWGAVLGCTSPVSFNISLDGSCLAYSQLVNGCTASCNIAIGKGPLFNVTSGSNNTAIGAGVLANLASGGLNVGIGGGALCSTESSYNVAVGNSALEQNATGACNTAVGYLSLYGAKGCCNVGLGVRTGYFLQSGSCNVAIGPDVQLPSAIGSRQLAIGFSCFDCWLTGDATKAIKPGAGIRDKDGDTGTLGQVLSSDGNNAIKWRNGVLGVTGVLPIVVDNTAPTNPVIKVNEAQTTAFGTVLGQTDTVKKNISLDAFCLALAVNNNGSSNIAFGPALICNTDGSGNVAISSSALRLNTTGSQNIAIGSNAMECNLAGLANIAVGVSALCKSTGNRNTALGLSALRNLASGSCNVALGQCAGCCMTDGSRNVIIGPEAQVPVFTGSDQLAIGFSSTDNWLTGCSDKSIRPGAGIRDCRDCLGTVGAVLRAGPANNTICWDTAGLTATCVIGGSTVVIENGLIISVT